MARSMRGRGSRQGRRAWLHLSFSQDTAGKSEVCGQPQPGDDPAAARSPCPCRSQPPLTQVYTNGN
ncbi:hypothetical protein E2C01_024178 [Portunus trituberculatus]|uniref:Uncharacterized protein n=1 Tax=Portunus trituberculatus TaxID=210409 RepID=A0A5B7ECG5_PORTR|nr:hypothetical protein [Portunus trituberculatus]